MEVLKGKLYLSKINKEKVQEDQYGKFIWVDVVPRRQADKYGFTHNITTWDKDSGTTYIADLKSKEVGVAAQKPAQSPFTPQDMASAQALVRELNVDEKGDLPF